MENKIALVESNMAKVFNRMRKSMSGKGSADCEVRLADDIIFCKLRMEYSMLEKRMLEFISEDPCTEAKYHRRINEPLLNHLNDYFGNSFPGIIAEAIHFRLNLSKSYYYATIELNTNLEKKIRNGEVSVPSTV